MVLCSLRQGTVCRYRVALLDAVQGCLPQTARALLLAGTAACDGAAAAGAAGPSSRVCARGGDHHIVKRTAFNKAIPHFDIIDCFPDRFWDSLRVHERFQWEFTALHCAVVSGKLRIAEKLLERGADVRARSSEGKEPLHWALSADALLKEDTRLRAVELLLRFGANPNCDNSKEVIHGNLAINDAAFQCGKSVLELLVKHGGNLHSRNEVGRGPLFYARDTETVKYLIECGVDPHTKDSEGQVALHSTSSLGQLSAVEALLPLYRGNVLDNAGITPLHLASGNGYKAVVNALLTATGDVNVVDCHGCTPLHFAAMKKFNIRYVEVEKRVERTISDDQLEVAALLLERGADPNKHTFAPMHCSEAVKSLSKTHSVYGNVAGGCTPLHWAVSRGKMEMVQLLLKHDACINDVDHEGRTVLHLASRKCDTVLVKLLLDEGADPLALDNKQQAPLHYLFFWRTLLDDNFVYSLVKEKSDPYKLDETSILEERRQPNEVARLLLDNNANVEQRDAKGRTPLHLAMLRGDSQIVQVLMEHGANPRNLNVGHEGSLCAFIGTYMLDTRSIIQPMLDAGEDPNRLDKRGNSPLHCATRKGKLEEAKLLLQYNANVNQKDAEGRSPLHLAIEYRHPDLIKLFLNHGANPLELDNDQQEPLNYVVMSGICDKVLVERLLNMGADPNRLDVDGISPLHQAVRRRLVEVVRLMLKHNARVNIMDSRGQTPIHYAMYSDEPEWEGYAPTSSQMGDYAEMKRVDHEKRLEIVQLLLEHNAEVNHKDAEGVTPLHLASRYCDQRVVQLLLDHRANPLALDNKHQGPLNYLYRRSIWCGVEDIPEILLAAGANPQYLDEDDSSPLHHAAKRNHLKSAKLYLMHNVSVNQMDAEGRTPLHLAIEKGHRDMVELLLNHDADPLTLDKREQGCLNYVFRNEKWHRALVEILLTAGSDPNRLNTDGSAPLHHAVRRKDCEAVRLLLRHGASANTKDSNGRNALHHAVDTSDSLALMTTLPIDVHVELSKVDPEKELEIVQLLLNHNADVEDEDAKGRTALNLAANSGDQRVIALLLGNRAKHLSVSLKE